MDISTPKNTLATPLVRLAEAQRSCTRIERHRVVYKRTRRFSEEMQRLHRQPVVLRLRCVTMAGTQALPSGGAS